MMLNELLQQYTAYTKEAPWRIEGNADIDVDGLNLCGRDSHKQHLICYVTSAKYAEEIRENAKIMALFISPELQLSYQAILCDRGGCVIITPQPEISFYRFHEFLYHHTGFYEKYTFEPVIGRDCKIAPTAVIEPGVILGDRVTLDHFSVIRSGSILEDDVTIGCGSVIGAEGFQIIRAEGIPPMHITHTGRCRICADVYISDHVTIEKSIFAEETYVGEHTKIDHLCCISHNVTIGAGAIITPLVCLLGSSVVEENSWIGGGASVLNRVVVGANSMVGMGSVVTRDVPPNTLVYGSPAKPKK